MRIVFGAFGQGHGHFSKAAVLVPLLEARGHDVLVISSGRNEPPAGYRFARHRHFPALDYVVSNGRIEFSRTLRKWAGELPQTLRHLWAVRRLVRAFEPDLILNDFEPLSASPLVANDCEVIAISRQVALSDPEIELPEGVTFERRLTRSVFRLFTGAARRLHGYHYAPVSSRCVPPIVRPDLQSLKPQAGEHILVYNHEHSADGGTAGELIEWSTRARCPVRAYGFRGLENRRRNLVEFCGSGRQTLLDDLRTARAVITTAGMTLPLEAFLLGKPVAVVPIPRQWEQSVNAFHLNRLELASSFDRWDFDRLLHLPAPRPGHRLESWLRTPAEDVLDHILLGTPADYRRHTDHPAAVRRAA